MLLMVTMGVKLTLAESRLLLLAVGPDKNGKVSSLALSVLIDADYMAFAIQMNILFKFKISFSFLTENPNESQLSHSLPSPFSTSTYTYMK